MLYIGYLETPETSETATQLYSQQPGKIYRKTVGYTQ